MARRYKRRSMDEAWELACSALPSQAQDHLGETAVSEVISRGWQGVSVGPFEDWLEIAGRELKPDHYYEFYLRPPSDESGPSDSFYGRVLVARDRSSDDVWFMWRPPERERSGPGTADEVRARVEQDLAGHAVNRRGRDFGPLLLETPELVFPAGESRPGAWIVLRGGEEDYCVYYDPSADVFGAFTDGQYLGIVDKSLKSVLDDL